jgi:uncharacterized MAPEG superfamily protein
MSVVAARLDPAKNNMLGSLPVFLALALLTLVKGGDTSKVAHAASIFDCARHLRACVREWCTCAALMRVVGRRSRPGNDGPAPDLASTPSLSSQEQVQ